MTPTTVDSVSFLFSESGSRLRSRISTINSLSRIVCDHDVVILENANVACAIPAAVNIPGYTCKTVVELAHTTGVFYGGIHSHKKCSSTGR